MVHVLHRYRRGREVLSRIAWIVAGCGVAGSALLRSEAVHATPVETLARQGAFVDAHVVVTSDPVLRRGQFEPYVVFRVRTESVVGRGQRHRVRAPVLVIADERSLHLELGSRVRLQGRLQQARTRDLAGVLSTRGPPDVLARPGPLLRAAGHLRASIRGAVAGRRRGPRALVPALVDGDDARMPDELTTAFRTTGLTHLLAVSGTNLTLVVGSLLLLARWAGVRARGLMVGGGPSASSASCCSPGPSRACSGPR